MIPIKAPQRLQEIYKKLCDEAQEEIDKEARWYKPVIRIDRHGIAINAITYYLAEIEEKSN